MENKNEFDKASSFETTFTMETKISTNIKASPDKIMRLLTDSNNFPSWNSTVISIDGQIKEGETIKLISKLDPKRTFKLKVSKLTPTSLVFQDGFAPMFSGIRTFTLIAKGDESTDFSMVESFKGLMLPMIKSSLPDFKPNFEQYALDLKQESEKVN